MLLCLKTLSAKARCGPSSSTWREWRPSSSSSRPCPFRVKAEDRSWPPPMSRTVRAVIPAGSAQGENAFFSGKVGCQQPAAARGQGAEHGHAARRSAEYRQQFALCQTRVAAGAQQAGHTVQKTLSVRPLLFQSAESRRRVRCDAARIAAPERRQAQAGGQIRRGARQVQRPAEILGAHKTQARQAHTPAQQQKAGFAQGRAFARCRPPPKPMLPPVSGPERARPERRAWSRVARPRAGLRPDAAPCGSVPGPAAGPAGAAQSTACQSCRPRARRLWSTPEACEARSRAASGAASPLSRA